MSVNCEPCRQGVIFSDPQCTVCSVIPPYPQIICLILKQCIIWFTCIYIHMLTVILESTDPFIPFYCILQRFA